METDGFWNPMSHNNKFCISLKDVEGHLYFLASVWGILSPKVTPVCTTSQLTGPTYSWLLLMKICGHTCRYCCLLYSCATGCACAGTSYRIWMQPLVHENFCWPSILAENAFFFFAGLDQLLCCFFFCWLWCCRILELHFFGMMVRNFLLTFPFKLRFKILFRRRFTSTFPWHFPLIIGLNGKSWLRVPLDSYIRWSNVRRSLFPLHIGWT